MTPPSLDPALAARFAALALANVEREYPNKLDHVLATAATRARRARCTRRSTAATTGTRASTCTGCWRAAPALPGLPQRAAIDALFDRHFARPRSRAEMRVPRAPGARSRSSAPTAGRGCSSSPPNSGAPTMPRAPLVRGARAARRRVRRALPRLPAQRAATRSATASTRTARSACCSRSTTRAARRAGALAADCVAAAQRWFGADRDAPGAWEPSGADFLSPALIEADLMRPCCPAPRSPRGSTRFLPGLARGEPAGAVHAGAGRRPQRSADRASRRPQPVARVVLARHRRRAAGGDPRVAVARRGRRASRRRLRRTRERRLPGRALARDVRAARATAGGGACPVA